MRASALVLLSALAASPASAQLSGGTGAGNAANQQFQQENAMRGLQQQQTFDRNQNQLQNSVRSNTAPSVGPTPLVRRPERER